MNWKLVHTLNRISRYLSPASFSNELHRALRRGKKDGGLTNINFSFTNLCSVDCIFCPQDRGGSKKIRSMSKQLLEKILNECSSAAFKKHHSIQVISVGENGDIFLHKECIDFLRMIRKKMPGAKIQCYTNFRMFTTDKIDIVLKEKLLDFIGCNIDGVTPQSYRMVKRADFDVVTKHLFYFLKKRRELWRDVPIHVSGLTFHDYIKGIYYGLGAMPLKLKETPIDINSLVDDFPDIHAFFRSRLDHPKDKIMRSSPIGWAERNQVDIRGLDYSKYFCPQVDRFQKEAFISPDGTWYACCWDGKNELVLGNVTAQSLNDIYFGQRRKDLILALKQKKFSEVGGPCLSVNCCQKLSIEKKG